jgi:hypothetical protein
MLPFLLKSLASEHLNLPRVGPISGAFDLLVSTVSEKMNIAKFGDRAFPEAPRFVVIEAS